MLRATTSPPRVCIVSPALADANNGNWQTASRWQRFLAPMCDVHLCSEWQRAADGTVLIALHARRSADSIERFRASFPDGPLALVLTGTDLYRDLQTDAQARHSLECATRVVVLQERGLDVLDAATRAKASVIVQSAPAMTVAPRPGDPDFVAVGHLRPEKDPQAVWDAARALAGDLRPPTIVHIGAALDAALGDAASATMNSCRAYRWLGARSHATTRRAIARARALVHPSRIEGGANVVIEAVRSRVPVLATRIDGNVGLLGADYGGYFSAGDAKGLAALMRRFIADAGFATHLSAQCAIREPLFRPSVERRAVRSLVLDLLASSKPRR